MRISVIAALLTLGIASYVCGQEYYLERLDQSGVGSAQCSRFDARLAIANGHFTYTSWCDGQGYSAKGTLLRADESSPCMTFYPSRLATRGCAVFANDRKTLLIYRAPNDKKLAARWQICLGGFSWKDNCQ